MKKIFIITLGGLIVVVLGLNVLLANRQPSPAVPQTIPTPTPVAPPQQITTSSLHMISITPESGAEDAGPIQQMKAVFDTGTQNITFAIYPETGFTLSPTGTSLTVAFSEALTPDTIYTYSFLDSGGNIIATGTFNTGSSTSGVAPLSQSYDNLEQTADNAQKQNSPDEFVENNVPYETKSFSVTSDFSNDGLGHFFFIVASKSPGGKNDFLTWLRSLGLNNEQIQKLDIRYQ